MRMAAGRHIYTPSCLSMQHCADGCNLKHQRSKDQTTGRSMNAVNCLQQQTLKLTCVHRVMCRGLHKFVDLLQSI